MSNFDDILGFIDANHRNSLSKSQIGQQILQQPKRPPLQTQLGGNMLAQPKKPNEMQIRMQKMQRLLNGNKTPDHDTLQLPAPRIYPAEQMAPQQAVYEDTQGFQAQVQEHDSARVQQADQDRQTMISVQRQATEVPQQAGHGAAYEQQNYMQLIGQLKTQIADLQRENQELRRDLAAVVQEREQIKRDFNDQLNELELQIKSMPDNTICTRCGGTLGAQVVAAYAKAPVFKNTPVAPGSTVPQATAVSQQPKQSSEFDKQWEALQMQEEQEERRREQDARAQKQAMTAADDPLHGVPEALVPRAVKHEEERARSERLIQNKQPDYKVLYQHQCLKILLPEQTQLKEAAAKRVVAVEETNEGNLLTWSRLNGSEQQISGAIQIDQIINVVAGEEAQVFRSKVLAARKAGYVQDIFDLISQGIVEEIQPKQLIKSQCSILFFTNQSVLCFDFGQEKDEFESFCNVLLQFGL